MEPHLLSHRARFSIPQSGCKGRPGSQQMTRQREIKNAMVGLRRVGSSCLPGWGPKDNSARWPDTLKDMAMNREQWRSCCHFLSGHIVWRWLLDRSDRNFFFAGQGGVFLLWSHWGTHLFPFHIYFIIISEIMIARKVTLSTCCIVAAVVWNAMPLMMVMMMMPELTFCVHNFSAYSNFISVLLTFPLCVTAT